ncbi:MAG TPA: glycogen debranching N-terminal domain-containing protein, partial [Noviherbaspirillum sp.]
MADETRSCNQWCVLANDAPDDERRRMLKHGDTFAVFDLCGDVAPARVHGAGIYHRDTRFLSRQVLRIEGHRPMYLGSIARDDNDLLLVELTN